MVAAPVQGQVLLKLSIQSGPHAGMNLDLSKEVIAIGRGPENDVVLAGDAKVSRQHGEFRYRDGGWHVVNLSQKNYLLVNGEKLNTAELEPGTKVQFGDSIIIVEFSAPKSADPDPVIQFQPPVAPVVSNPIPQASAPLSFPAMTPPQAPSSQAQSVSILNNSLARPQAPTPPPTMYQTSGNYGGPIGYSGGPVNTGMPASSSGGMDDGKKRFYIILAVVAVLAWFFLSDSGKKVKKDPNAIRSADQIKMDIQTTERSIVQLKEEEEKRRSIQYKKAQENLVRGFRDFQQGQYSRARDSFQVVLNLDPENELAQRYVQLAQIKFDQQVKELMLQGARNKEKLNWRLCMDSFSKVMTMLQGRKDNPTYAEAQKYFEACRLEAEGKY